MAKMYYNLEEATAKLGCTEDQLRVYVREGKLREFRDAGKLNYRVDEVDKLVSGSTGGNVLGHDSDALGVDDLADIALSPIETDSGIMKALSSSGSTPGLAGSEVPIDIGGSASGSAILDLGDSTGAPKTPEKQKSDSGAGKFKLDDSGSRSGADVLSLDEVDKDAVQGMKKDDTVITNIGISVFDDDDLEIAADPMAKTLMTGADEHLGLDGSGGGSGLLDLTRESDDTSLGAELLEGIDMGDTGAQGSMIPSEETPATPVAAEDIVPEPDIAEPAIAMVPVQAVVGRADPTEPIFAGLLMAATIVLALAGAMNVGVALDTWPGYLHALADNFWLFLLGTCLLGGIFAGVGWLMSRPPGPPKPPKAAKEKKPLKEKKAKK
jgi:hypothetical protein